MGICTRGGSLKGGKFPHTKKAPFKLSQGGPSELDRRVQQQRLRRQNRENLPQKSLQNSPFKHRSNLHTTAHSRQWGQSTRLRLGCGNFPPLRLPPLVQIPILKSFDTFFCLYLLLYLILRRLACLFGSWGSSASIQKLFCRSFFIFR